MVFISLFKGTGKMTHPVDRFARADHGKPDSARVRQIEQSVASLSQHFGISELAIGARLLAAKDDLPRELTTEELIFGIGHVAELGVLSFDEVLGAFIAQVGIGSA